ncbi:bifunctional PTS fructose transporter subunit IIA/HPr protein [Aggregatibacter aphrophilus]|uniref:fused PTS fructose transporter subunit IIA/HPr protein n=1 Tax=Aggregatibacter aphrophilus TaxID=732 RepID=UPI0006836065|nr:fused PTS fructose transporter subunit IIA/HPr protein [Aggregatibacter aphrophilus]AKU62620.1 bifunctional PTS fructose transporter subunit IIA/HPr protein [Aggregatibacter aphrophilus]
MFNLPESNIHLAAQADNKQQAIELAANALEQAGYVEHGYLQGMLGREQQTSTFLGNGIAIPHGTLETRGMVKDTGVQIFQFPQGIEWGEGNIAYVVIGIAARSDEHLALLRQLTHVLGDEDTAAKLATLTDVKKFRAILMGEADDFSVNADNLSLNVDTQSLLTLIAINAGKLEQQSAVNNQYVSEVIANPALPLAQGLWVTDAAVGNQKNGLAFSRAVQPFQLNNKAVHGVVTVAYVNDQINDTLARLLDPQVQQVLLNGESAQIAAALNGKPIPQATTQTTSTASAAPSVAAGSVVGTFTIRNEHGLHARPSAILVNEVKKFTSKITVENLTRGGASVNAKSLMKIVALGVTQGHRLRFVAEGDDAQAAMEAIGKVIAAGLGEGVSAVPPSEPDTIEVAGGAAPATSAPSSESAVENPSESVEGIFEVKNEHGLHARPAAVLVNEVKKYNANIAVQNLDRDTPLVSAKSLMKVVALGVVKGHRLRFVASGEQAQQAIDGIGAVINAGLGE